jgi:hypothetical protein
MTDGLSGIACGSLNRDHFEAFPKDGWSRKVKEGRTTDCGWKDLPESVPGSREIHPRYLEEKTSKAA